MYVLVRVVCVCVDLSIANALAAFIPLSAPKHPINCTDNLCVSGARPNPLKI